MNTKQSAEMLVPTDVRPLAGYRIRLRFSDEVEGEIDLSHLAWAEPFQAWQDRAFFESVRLTPWGGIARSNGIDVDEDWIYKEFTGRTIDETQKVLHNA